MTSITAHAVEWVGILILAYEVRIAQRREDRGLAVEDLAELAAFDWISDEDLEAKPFLVLRHGLGDRTGRFDDALYKQLWLEWVPEEQRVAALELYKRARTEARKEDRSQRESGRPAVRRRKWLLRCGVALITVGIGVQIVVIVLR